MALAQLHARRRRGVHRRPDSGSVGDGAPAPFGGTWVIAASPLMRLRGLAGRPPDRTVMVLPRCRDVHTLTMRHPLDLAFVDRAGRVIEVHRLVLPGTRLRSDRAFGAIERFARPGPWLMRGDSVEIPGGKKGGPRRVAERRRR